MKTAYLIFAGSLLSLSSHAQNLSSQPKGSYGGDGKNAPNLLLNENHTFVYTDRTKASKPIVAEGTWSIEGDELILQSDSKARLNKRYTVTREGMCIKTRKKLAFYTLCNCKF